jgi:pyruvate dehydrogenase E2 component (dihydrolipoamide acetyltransferase)
MPDVVMPKLSDSMEEGTILTWLKRAGERVAAGDELLEIETDKSTVTHGAEVAGVLEILVAEGTTVAVGTPIARIGEAVAPSGDPPVTSPSASETPLGSAAVLHTDRAARPANGNGDGARRTAATPLARRIAAVHGVALDEIQGTGPLGRITRDDVLGRAGLAPPPSPLPAWGSPPPQEVSPAAAGPASAPPDAATSRREPTRLQQVVARRMADAKATIPHFQVQTEVVMDAALALRAQLKALAGEDGSAPTLNDLIIKAAAVPCATIRSPTDPSGTAALTCTPRSTSGWRWRPMTRSSCRPCSTPPPSRWARSRARPARWRSASAAAPSPRPSCRVPRSPSPTSGCSG